MQNTPPVRQTRKDSSKSDRLTTSGWNRLNPKAKQDAHRLRQALAGALELHVQGRWGRQEIEHAGMRDFERVFGHTIKSRQFWRLFDRVVARDAGAGKFNDLDLYVYGRLGRNQQRGRLQSRMRELPTLAMAVLNVKDATRLTDNERLMLWGSSMREYQRLIDDGTPDCRARRLVIAALDESGLPMARSREALAKNFGRKLDRWVAGGFKPSAIKDQRKDNPGRAPAANLSEEDKMMLIAHTVKKGSLRRAWREARRDGLLSPAMTQGYIANPASKSYVPASISRQIKPVADQLEAYHLGPRQARLNGPYITRNWTPHAPGDWYQADDTTLPVYYWEEGAEGLPCMMRGQFLPMIDLRTNRILTFALHSERNYNAIVIRKLILTTHDTYGLPRRGFYFENGIWRSSKLIKGATPAPDMIDLSETEMGLTEWDIVFRHAKPGNARAKPVERVIGLLQDRIEDQPGYCGRNEQVEKFERLSRQMLLARRGGQHPSEFCLHRDEWVKRLTAACDLFNHEPQEGKLKGQSPREAWESLFNHKSPLVKLTPDTRYLLANHRRPLKVTRNGVCIQIGKNRTWFHNDITGQCEGRIVQAYFNTDDLSSIFIKLSPADLVAAVIPASLVIDAMDATSEQIEAAQAGVAAHNQHVRTVYKAIEPYFPDNGPSPFRKVLADPDTVELGKDIADAQTAILEEQKQTARSQRQVARLRGKFGVRVGQNAISDDRLRQASELMKGISTDADTSPKP
jgi:hypothetical protein